MIKAIEEMVSGSDVIVAVDPKPENFRYYRGVDIITPNHHEAAAFCGFKINDDESLVCAGEYILDKLKCRSVLITQGKEGMTLFESGTEPCHIPTVAQKVFDVSGAGDTVISTLSLGIASGMTKESAALISNFASGIVVGEVGTSTVQQGSSRRPLKAEKTEMEPLMSTPREPDRVKLIASLFSSEKGLIDQVINELADKFGDTDVITPWLMFDRTRYYEKEMGWPFTAVLLHSGILCLRKG
jgi:bifunctional ADP-heptose synthase (sugar kinase/adenylyltransferase)